MSNDGTKELAENVKCNEGSVESISEMRFSYSMVHFNHRNAVFIPSLRKVKHNYPILLRR